jgi:hypothetical protein
VGLTIDLKDPCHLQIGGETSLNQSALSVEEASKLVAIHVIYNQRSHIHRLRCDRNHPCGNCTRRGLDSCTYVNSGTTRGQSNSISKVSIDPNLPDRVNQLERLVTSMLSNSANVASGAPNMPVLGSSASQPTVVPEENSTYHADQPELSLPSSPGFIFRASDSSTYVDSTHWTAILDEVHLASASFPWLFASTPGQLTKNLDPRSQRYYPQRTRA